MNDLDMLTLAAKAADLIIMGQVVHVNSAVVELSVRTKTGKPFAWSPLEHNDDALSLAVKLSLKIEIKTYAPIPCTEISAKPPYSIWTLETHSGAPERATRRAITRAAAEIGSMMP